MKTSQNATAHAVVHLNTRDLANRWRVSDATLRNWRWAGRGPCWMKLEGRAIYRLADVESYEAAHLQSTVMGG
jgi:predicted site-specific integrase-resolvase